MAVPYIVSSSPAASPGLRANEDYDVNNHIAHGQARRSRKLSWIPDGETDH